MQPGSEEMSEIQQESSRLILDPRVIFQHVSLEQIKDTFPDEKLFIELVESVRKTGGNLNTLYESDESWWDSAETTIVGRARTGKTTFATMAGALLGAENVSVGLPVRALAGVAESRGHQPGNQISAQLRSDLLHIGQEMRIYPGMPRDGIEQRIVLPGGEFTYDGLSGVNREIMGNISQDPEILNLIMEQIKDVTKDRFSFIDGRALLKYFPKPLARLYVERPQGEYVPENVGQSWQLDSPYDPGTISIINPEGESYKNETAHLVAAFIAQRLEAQVSSDQAYPVKGTNAVLVTGQPAKVAELNYALEHLDQIPTSDGLQSIPASFTEVMKTAVMTKARNARGKIHDPQVIVESTGLFFPDLPGIPPELFEILSKKNPDFIFQHAGVDELKSYSVTYTVIIDKESNEKITHGITPGVLRRSAKGTGGFGWDDRFVPDGEQGTYAELGERKYVLSSRAKAIRKLNIRSN